MKKSRKELAREIIAILRRGMNRPLGQGNNGQVPRRGDALHTAANAASQQNETASDFAQGCLDSAPRPQRADRDDKGRACAKDDPLVVAGGRSRRSGS